MISPVMGDEGVHERHHALLDTFRELIDRVDGFESDRRDPVTLGATIAFLRESLLPFARWEDSHGAVCAEVAEDTAFEHAFLAAEIDRLAAAVLEHWRADGSGGEMLAGIRRTIHRIEAVLELHIEKARDRDLLFSPEPTASEVLDPVENGRRPGARAMSTDEVTGFLLGHDWGALATIGDGVPYAVPVSYGFDGRHVYVATGPGRKRSNLEAHPATCLTVMEVESGCRWSSVLVAGDAAPVGDVRGKLHALRTIARQRTAAGPPSPADLARAARATVFRITAREMSGRVRE